MALILVVCSPDEHEFADTLKNKLLPFRHQVTINSIKESYVEEKDAEYFESFNTRDLLVLIWSRDQSMNLALENELHISLRAEDDPFIAIGVIRELSGSYPYQEPGCFWDDPDLVDKINARITEITGESFPVITPEIHSDISEDPGPTQPETTQEKNYWMLKIDPETWDRPSLSVGQQVMFSSFQEDHTTKRPDYEQFGRIKTGDEVLVYAHDAMAALIGIFRVTKGLNREDPNVERVDFLVDQFFDAVIPLNLFQEDITFAENLIKGDPNVLFPLDAFLFQLLIDRGKNELVSPGDYLDDFRSDIDHVNTMDKLSFSDDIESLGTVICLEHIHPPLAIGLFGNWGSGKSFFMEKLDAYIKKIKGTDPRFVENVVSVRFNSWHYSDSNLWASLITDIFDELVNYGKKEEKTDEIKKLSESLQVTLQQKAATERKKQEIQEEVNQLTSIRDDNRKKLKDASGLELLKRWVSDKNVKHDLESLDNEGVEKILDEKQKVDDFIGKVSSIAEQLQIFGKHLVSFQGLRWWLLLSLSIVVYVLVLLIKMDWKVQWDAITGSFAGWWAVGSLFLSRLLAGAESALRTIKTINERLASLKKTVDARAAKQPADLAAAERHLLHLSDDIQKLDKDISDKQLQLDDIFTGKKLSDFISHRAKEEQYSRQLGVISWIRKDFETLDELLREQHAASVARKKEILNPKEVKLKIDRIVLYVDDLDRCNENTVVKVLEAINLLLAFPLFVVVVGVDPTWLDNALNTKYQRLFKSAAKFKGKTGLRQITSFDYLDKIFQIPFAIKPVQEEDRISLIQYLTSKDRAQVVAVVENNADDQQAPSTPVPHDALAPSVLPGTTVANQPVVSPGAARLMVVQETSSQKPVTESPGKAADRAKFTPAELTFMEAVSGLFGETPRMINRYVNIYRIIKSHKKYKTPASPSGRDFKPTLLSLGMVIGCPELAQQYIDMLFETVEKDFRLTLAVARYGPIKTYIEKNINPELLNGLTIDLFTRNIALIARFSFRTHVVQEVAD
ncbi:P-loop NTPase fold protein [Mucilaginibacter sp. AW1-7]|jgi:hypothetical protein|uniref:P-loop NTPase fold protein n=1 Tax=Mucilaginibacter sp. AW1-7 TaxID=3349874 RepID=UPI003F736A34